MALLVVEIAETAEGGAARDPSVAELLPQEFGLEVPFLTGRFDSLKRTQPMRVNEYRESATVGSVK
jgi:hypothetical protein